jgi:hypothetical protein
MKGTAHTYFLSKGRTIRFCQIQLAEGLGHLLNVVRHMRTLTDLSVTAVEKFKPDICRFFGTETTLVSQAELPVTRSDHLIESGVLKEAR